MIKRFFIFIIAFVIGMNASIFTLQAQTWEPLGAGIDGFQVYALAVYNGNLIAGGSLDSAGHQFTFNRAQWNGTSWSPTDTAWIYSMNNGGSINSLLLYNGNLIAGGEFYVVGNMITSGIAQFNGTKWDSLGGGMGYTAFNCGPFSNSPCPGTVYALTVYNGNLIAGGYFDSAGRIPVHNIAQWNGTTWSPLGNGIPNGTVYALTVYNGNLIASGNFLTVQGAPANYIAQWNGTAWSPFSTGLNGWANALVMYNGNLITGGIFDSAGGQAANRIAQWNGTSWSQLGLGVNGLIDASLTVYNGNLITGGGFDSAGGKSANSIALWNGSSWSPLGLGIGSIPCTTPFATSCLGVYNNELYAAGYFHTAGCRPASNIAEWCDTCTTGVNEIKQNKDEVYLYPNPANTILNVETKIEEERIYIFNSLGQQVLCNLLTNNLTTIPVSNLAEGIYYYRITDKEGKLIKAGKQMLIH